MAMVSQMEVNHLAFKAPIDIRKELKSEFVRRQTKNSRYSLRAFARSLKLSHPTLSEILTGKRRISRRNLEKIGTALGWKPRQLESALESLGRDPENYLQLESPQIARLNEWYFNVILELFLVEGFQPKVDWIAKALDLKTDVVKEALDRLLEAGLIKRSRRGQLSVASHKTTTVGNLNSKSDILKIQSQFLKKQDKALGRFPVESQSSLGLTIPMSPADLPEARIIIYRCLKDLSRLLNRKGVRRSQVYRLQIGLFPLTDLKSC